MALNEIDDLMAALVASDHFSRELERMYYDNLLDEVGADLVLAHIELMRETGAPVPAPALALELLIKRNKVLLR